MTLNKHTCVVFVGDKEDDKVCQREALHGYESKVQLENGNYHASNTTTHAREIDVCTHFSVNPNNTDAGLVSLTAD